MSEVKTYAVNCNDAWLNTDGDDISGSYVKYADYIALATKLDLAERACAELAAENAVLAAEVEAMKSAHQDAVSTIMYTANRTGVLYTEKTIQMSCKTPATDAFLAEVRAQGVEMAISQALMDVIPVNRMQFISRMTDFAAQLRKGGEQK